MKLNLGCGTDIKKDYVNIDVVKLPGVNKIVDLNKLPLPFNDNSADEIYLNHVIDHLDKPTLFLKDCHRVLKEKGRIIIIIPHFTSATAFWGDIRKHVYSWQTFKRYQKNDKRAYYFEFHFNKISVDFQFQTKPFWLFWYGYILRKIANKWPYLYEMTFLSAFPCRQMYIEMVK